MPDDKKLALSRRQLLGGLGAVGAASAGAGLGTTALFSDEESFNNNEIQAGELDLRVDYTFSGEIGQESSQTVSSGTLNGDLSNGDPPTGEFSVSDVKPGDSGTIEFELDLMGNPAYLWMFADITADGEGDNPEPEPQPGDDPAGGELDETFDVSISDNGAQLISGSLNEVFDRTVSNPSLGVYGLPLDSDNSGYDPAARAVGTPLTAPTSFVEPGVNAFTEFESGDALSATVESAQDSGSTVAHATSNGAATNDYVTSIVDAGGVGLGTTPLEYEYREGTDNDYSAPDEVYLLVNDDAGNDRVVFQSFDSGLSGYQTRDVANAIVNNVSGANKWLEITSITSSGLNTIGGALTDDSNISISSPPSPPSSTIKRIGFGRGHTGPHDAVLDVYYRNLNIGGTTYQFPTADTEYAASGRDAFSPGAPTTTITVDLAVPASVGNQIQGDSLTFDIGFYAVQERNNDGSTSA